MPIPLFTHLYAPLLATLIQQPAWAAVDRGRGRRRILHETKENKWRNTNNYPNGSPWACLLYVAIRFFHVLDSTAPSIAFWVECIAATEPFLLVDTVKRLNWLSYGLSCLFAPQTSKGNVALNTKSSVDSGRSNQRQPSTNQSLSRVAFTI